jgi:Mce-associated membrane protein
VADKTREAGTAADETDVTADETAAAPDETTAAEDETAAAPDETAAALNETVAALNEAIAAFNETGAAPDETVAAPDETAADETGAAPDETAADETVAAPDETSETATETDEAAEQAPESPAGKTESRRTRLAAVILGAVTVVLAGFGVWATLEAHSLRSTAAPQNLALTDGAATSAVNRQVVSAINTVFSYNYANTGATRRAAQGLLTGPAIQQYNTYFALVTKDAPAQKLVVTTRVTNSGVELLTGNRARVLVFANQQDTRAGTKQTSYAGAVFAVTAVHQGNRWKIENIDTFSGSQ